MNTWILILILIISTAHIALSAYFFIVLWRRSVPIPLCKAAKEYAAKGYVLVRTINNFRGGVLIFLALGVFILLMALYEIFRFGASAGYSLFLLVLLPDGATALWSYAMYQFNVLYNENEVVSTVVYKKAPIIIKWGDAKNWSYSGGGGTVSDGKHTVRFGGRDNDTMAMVAYIQQRVRIT